MTFICLAKDSDQFEQLPNVGTEINSQLPFLLAPISPNERTLAAQEAKDFGLLAPGSLTSLSTQIAVSSQVSHGCFLSANVVVGSKTNLSCFVVLNRLTSVGHHCSLEPFVSTGPGVVVCSEVQIGFGIFIGAGAVILPRVKIGKNAIVGAGALVTKDVEDFQVVAGSPAKVINRNEDLLPIGSCLWC